MAVKYESTPGDLGVNNNVMSSAVVMDEGGNALATLERFFFFNSFLTIGVDNLQRSPVTRTGWTVGPEQQGLERFGY